VRTTCRSEQHSRTLKHVCEHFLCGKLRARRTRHCSSFPRAVPPCEVSVAHGLGQPGLAAIPFDSRALTRSGLLPRPTGCSRLCDAAPASSYLWRWFRKASALMGSFVTEPHCEFRRSPWPVFRQGRKGRALLRRLGRFFADRCRMVFGDIVVEEAGHAPRNREREVQRKLDVARARHGNGRAQ